MHVVVQLASYKSRIADICAQISQLRGVSFWEPKTFLKIVRVRIRISTESQHEHPFSYLLLADAYP
jgi:hypothetical protein